jgi:hypothetical protein
MMAMKTMLNFRSIFCLALAGGLTLAGRPAAAGDPSAAALAKAPANRGRVVGAACNGRDGYQPDYTALEARAAAAAPRAPDGRPAPINLLSYRDATTPLPLQPHQLPPGQAHCVQTAENPNGYLTMNCRSDADCPAPASCDGSLCRAACTSDADCLAPATCLNLGAIKGVRYCRCDDCVLEHNVKAKAKTKVRRASPRLKHKGAG